VYLSKNSRTQHGRNALVQHGLDLGVEVDDLRVAASETALAHVSLGAGHEGGQFHVGVRLAQFLHHFLERMELAACSVNVVLVHLETEILV
jgi:hypothetical protein